MKNVYRWHTENAICECLMYVKRFYQLHCNLTSASSSRWTAQTTKKKLSTKLLGLTLSLSPIRMGRMCTAHHTYGWTRAIIKRKHKILTQFASIFMLSVSIAVSFIHAWQSFIATVRAPHTHILSLSLVNATVASQRLDVVVIVKNDERRPLELYEQKR